MDQLDGRQKLDAATILDMLADRAQPADAELPETGVGLEWERILAPMFIISPDYGTRSSSVVLIHQSGEMTFWERTFVKTDKGIKTGETRRFQLK